jgi:hypothetical protein
MLDARIRSPMPMIRPAGSYSGADWLTKWPANFRRAIGKGVPTVSRPERGASYGNGPGRCGISSGRAGPDGPAPRRAQVQPASVRSHRQRQQSSCRRGDALDRARAPLGRPFGPRRSARPLGFAVRGYPPNGHGRRPCRARTARRRAPVPPPKRPGPFISGWVAFRPSRLVRWIRPAGHASTAQAAEVGANLFPVHGQGSPRCDMVLASTCKRRGCSDVRIEECDRFFAGHQSDFVRTSRAPLLTFISRSQIT